MQVSQVGSAQKILNATEYGSGYQSVHLQGGDRSQNQYYSSKTSSITVSSLLSRMESRVNQGVATLLRGSEIISSPAFLTKFEQQL